MKEKILEGLNPAQREAVTSGAGRILVVAPPGSGKTRVLATRFARLIMEGTEPGAIMAVTFTVRAAMELGRRVREVSGRDPDLNNTGTFHGICLNLLKRSRPGFTLYGRKEVTACLRELGVRDAEKAAGRISFIKNSSCAPVPPERDGQVFYRYTECLRERNALDLDDLILETIKALAEGSPAADAFRRGLKHIMVDEFQDINPPQARLVELLAGAGAALFAIGDPDQAIYSFRGASAGAFLNFERDWPGARVIRLSVNYRSAERIVLASTAVIARNRKRIANRARARRGGGEVVFVEAPDTQGLARYIIKEIERGMGGLTSLTVGGAAGEARFSDFAVLVRTNREAREIAGAFKASSIPVHLVGPPGPGFIGFLEHLREASPDPGLLLTDYIREEAGAVKLEDRLLAVFLRAAEPFQGVDGGRCGECLEAFLEECALMGPADDLDIEADRVNIMTLHMAKGLEFQCVFIAGVEDGLIPLRGGTDLEEERRLFYVGMTRARESLYLLSAKERRTRGGVEASRPSPFIAELPQGVLKRVNLKKGRQRRRPPQRGLFE